eukprot:GHVN01049596.1.p1 GENE.GHVN01049596.1~~GHVN01049596.1.p1  ORF type:complete len:163 (-),score=30.33 GHVN01049596.1:89-577(-)
MAEENDETFESVASGASVTVPVQAGTVRKGGFVMLKGKPCKVVEYSTSKTGKHGHAKAHIVGIELFTSKKYEDICPTSHNMEEPVIKRTELQLIDIQDEDFVTLLGENGVTRSDVRLPRDADGSHDDVAKQVLELQSKEKSIIVTLLGACGQEKIIAAKELT